MEKTLWPNAGAPGPRHLDPPVSIIHHFITARSALFRFPRTGRPRLQRPLREILRKAHSHCLAVFFDFDLVF